MPLILPPFTIYQASTFPVRGNWNNAPPEGDFSISFEIDWQYQGGASHCVQCNTQGGGVQPISQIAALSIDNTNCDADVSFVFPDSGYTLTVPAKASLITPVFTNALNFYVLAPQAASTDITRFLVLNSVPPPVAALPTEEQTISVASGIALSANATTVLIPVGTSGEIDAFSIVLALTTAGSCLLELIDGNSNTVWGAPVVNGAGDQTIPIVLPGIRARFFNGLAAVVTSTSFTAGSNASVNIYYGSP